MQAVSIYGKSREKRPRRRKKQNVAFVCECCNKPLIWHIPRNEGVFCEKCWAKYCEKVGEQINDER